MKTRRRMGVLATLSALMVFGVAGPAVAIVSPHPDPGGHIDEPGFAPKDTVCGQLISGAESLDPNDPNGPGLADPSGEISPTAPPDAGFGPGGNITRPSTLGTPGAANAVDYHWVHDDARVAGPLDPLVFDFGAPVLTADYYPVIDHPDLLPDDPFAGEVFGTNDPNSDPATWIQGDLVQVWEEGWDTANPDTFVDDYVQRYTFSEPVRYVLVLTTDALLVDDAEVDAVCTPTIVVPAGRILVDKVTDPAGSAQVFEFTATYDPDGFTLTDAAAPNDSGELAPGSYEVLETPLEGWIMTSQNCVSSLGHDEFPAGIELDDGEIVTCTFVNTLEAPTGGEGCTPGFWKQQQHANAWIGTGFSPNQSFETVFGVPNAFPGPGPTLLQALGQGGGGMNALGRHAVAALLNSASPNVDYEFTTAEVIAAVQAAVANPSLIEQTKNQLAAENEQGCPINGKTAQE